QALWPCRLVAGPVGWVQSAGPAPGVPFRLNGMRRGGPAGAYKPLFVLGFSRRTRNRRVGRGDAFDGCPSSVANVTGVTSPLVLHHGAFERLTDVALVGNALTLRVGADGVHILDE